MLDKRLFCALVLIVCVNGFSATKTAVLSLTPHDGFAATVDATADHTFSPSPVSINVGDTVQFVNTSDDHHTVTDDPSQAQQSGDAVLPVGAQPFDSGDLSPGDTFTQTFTVAGTYKYFCKYHEDIGMVGEIDVQ